YGNFHKLQYDIMGPFCKIPFMECNHGVISANHHLSGKIKINDTVINFKDGNGYIEKDWGNSFPKKYAWTQCNSFEQQNISIMASAAEIPFLGLNFNGCIAFVIYGGKEYRLATYNGAKILKYTQNQIIIKNHKNFLKIDIEKGIQNQLIAPQNGGMTRKIQEQPCCNARFRFYEEGNLLFDLTGKNVGFEYVNIST
ncbi:MAG: hypothetical protein K0R90_979, partial [Oscillospiraceae bacterium]|nr:hypothetical protein [Oscillospiraceae bacterium]